MAVKSIYLAGPINHTRCSWRRIEGPEFHGGDFISYTRSLISYTEVIDGWRVTGPWMIGCDHGCYHGPASHGMGPAGCFAFADHAVIRHMVLQNAVSQIHAADVVYARIDRDDCYGTIFELGLAATYSKRIYIDFEGVDPTEFWFCCMGSELSNCTSAEEYRSLPWHLYPQPHHWAADIRAKR